MLIIDSMAGAWLGATAAIGNYQKHIVELNHCHQRCLHSHILQQLSYQVAGSTSIASRRGAGRRGMSTTRLECQVRGKHTRTAIHCITSQATAATSYTAPMCCHRPAQKCPGRPWTESNSCLQRRENNAGNASPMKLEIVQYAGISVFPEIPAYWGEGGARKRRRTNTLHLLSSKAELLKLLWACF